MTALKGYMGNLVSGCGAVELIASLIGVNRGRIPAILNCDQPEPEMELDLVLKSPRPTRNPTFVNTNLTPNGQAAALVIRGCPPEPAGAATSRIELSPARGGECLVRGWLSCGESS